MNEKKLARTEGQTPFERFQALAKGLVNVPKAEVEKKVKAARQRQARAKRRG